MNRIAYQQILTAFLLIAGIGGLMHWKASRSIMVNSTSESVSQMHRTNLLQQSGRWHRPGLTNGYTGLLVDTYPDGAIKSQSTVSNGFLHGISKGWHTNGLQQVREHFVAGVSHGLRTKWHPNGEKLSEVMISHGKLEGTFRSWHSNGECAEEVELKDGLPNGLSKAYFAGGFLKSKVTLHNGKVLDQKFFKDGEFQESTSSTARLVVSGQLR